MRLDVWLDVTCLFKTRSEAKKACEGGKVDVNGQAAKPHREIKPGDEIDISRRFGRRQKVGVRALAEHHLKKADARLLYEDLTKVLAEKIAAAPDPDAERNEQTPTLMFMAALRSRLQRFFVSEWPVS